MGCSSWPGSCSFFLVAQSTGGSSSSGLSRDTPPGAGLSRDGAARGVGRPLADSASFPQLPRPSRQLSARRGVSLRVCPTSALPRAPQRLSREQTRAEGARFLGLGPSAALDLQRRSAALMRRREPRNAARNRPPWPGSAARGTPAMLRRGAPLLSLAWRNAARDPQGHSGPRISGISGASTCARRG